MSIGRALSIVEGPDRMNQEKNEKIEELNLKIDKINNMTLKEYIEHKNEKEREKEQDNISDEEEDTMMDEIEKKINQLMEICKKNKAIKYPKNF